MVTLHDPNAPEVRKRLGIPIYNHLWHGNAKLLQESVEVVQRAAAVMPRGISPGIFPEVSLELSVLRTRL